VPRDIRSSDALARLQIMADEPIKPNPVSLAREILKFRKEKHPFGYNYAVRVRLGHAEIQDLTAIADIVLALEELGYEVRKVRN
jgi:hypothetical protein